MIYLWLTGLLLVQLAASTPVVTYYRSPAAGGIAGGTVLTMDGRGFAEDVYASSNVIWFQGDDGTRVICDFISYTATPNRIQCRTRPYPNATEGEDSPAMKIAIVSSSGSYVSSLTFTYRWSYTYSVQMVYPNSGPSGSLVELAGYLSGAIHTYERLYLGDLQCDHIDSSTGLPYGLRWYRSLRHAKCRVQNQVAGAYNATIQFRDWANTQGRSWNYSAAMYLMFDGSLGMFELYPDIYSVSPNAGSRLGGTLITVTGSGFGSNEQDVEVDVDGIPCQILSHNATHIHCWTGRPHDDDLSVADDDGSFSVTSSGHRFKGSRGVSVRTFKSGNSISSLESLRSHATYPDQPSSYSSYPSYSTYDYKKMNTYGERLEAFFNPQTTGDHSFFVTADHRAEVQVAVGTNINNLSLPVATTTRATGWMNYFNDPSNQRSEKMPLEKGQDYLLVSEFAETYHLDYINVAVLMHDTPYTFSQTQQSNREQQLISLSTSGRYEMQSLAVVINSSELEGTEGSGQEEHGVLLDWGGYRTAVITAADLLNNPNETVASALLSLFWAQCSYIIDHGIFLIQYWNDAVYGFESNETHSNDDLLWQRWNGDPPAVVRNESLCGRSSLYLREGRSLVFNLPESSDLVIELEDYPYYMCMGYKLPPGYGFSLLFRLSGVAGWLSAYFNHDITSISTTTMGSIVNLDSSADIRDDDQWYYTCINLQAIIANGFYPPEDYEFIGVHFLEGFGFYADREPQSRGFYLDEVSFSHSPRTLDLEAYIPASSANGIILENITATNETVALGDGLVAVTINLEFNPLDCGYDFSVFSAQTTNTSQSVVQEMSVMRLQEASQPLGGVFSLVVNGNGYSGQTAPIAYDANTEEIKAELESISGIGTVTVTDGARLGVDRYQTGCPGRLIYVQFDDLAGDQPMILVESGDLSGEGVSVAVSEVVPGGMMASPIPGHMLQTVERTPQVHVRVKGQLASCSGGHALYHTFNPSSEDVDFCRFSYSPPLTPHILSVTPTTTTHGDTLTVTGSGFGEDPSLILVLLGDVPCAVTSASGVEVTCELQQGTAGQKQIFLQVVGGNGGIAVVNDSVLPLEYTIVIYTIVPGEGSQKGGTEITITGTGFAPTSSDSEEWDPGNEILSDALQRALVANGNGCSGGWRNVVTIGDNDCDVITADHMTLTCVTPANEYPGTTNTYDIIISLVCDDPSFFSTGVIVGPGFTYSDPLTPEVTGATPDQGSIHGGNSITIEGTGFSDDPSAVTVKLGDAECTVTSAASTAITCTTTPHTGGTVPVVVMVTGKGFASGDFEYEFVFTVSSISHCEGSLLGGQLLNITGEGFGTDLTHLEVSLGSYPCKVVEISDTLIQCITSPTTTTHIIDNNATSEEYGLGYVWSPDEITVAVGDSVLWNWYGTSFTRRLSVQQVAAVGETEPVEGGFSSENGVRGSFTHLFMETGDYYYIAGGYGHIGFNGTIHVVPLADIEVPLTITINSVAMEIPPTATCGAPPPHPFTRYTFSVSHTPVVHGGMEAFSYLHQYSVPSSGLSTSPDHNLFTIGGGPCLSSSISSTTLVQPDLAGPADNTITYYTGEEVINCELLRVEPGTYRPVLHVAGKGWGLVTVVTEIAPSLEIDSPQNQAGSLRGGTVLHITTEGLSFDDITKLRVEVGNTPCAVQQIQGIETYEHLYCLTQPPRDDGYSSLVHALDPVAYWTLQTDYYDLEGRYVGSDGNTSSFRNDGELGSSADAEVRGEVEGRKEGISHNSLTNQAVLFNDSHIEVPFHTEFAEPVGFGMGLWLKLPAEEMESSGSGGDLVPSLVSESGYAASGEGEVTPVTRGPYQVVVDFASYVDGVAGGYVVVINPCGQPEFWLASGHSHHHFSDSEECPLLTVSDCSPLTPDTCSGLSVVVTGYLPTGVWNVIRCGNCNLGTEWGLISVGWKSDSAEFDETQTTTHPGEQVFHFNDRRVASVSTTYHSPAERPLLIGGADRLPQEGGWLGDSSSNLPLTVFVGYVDEVSVYDRALSSEEVEELFEYGSTDKQKIWIRVEPVDGIGTGHNLETVLELNGAFDEVLSLDWNGVDNTEIELNEGKAFLFEWASLKGVWQVTKETYESCDITNEPIKEWSPPRLGEEVVVWFDSGQIYYFIDPVAGNCLSGSKLKITVGQNREVTWTIDHAYSEISIPEGTGLLFQWSGTTPHDLIEMSSPQSTSQDCTFVGSSAQSLGKVVKTWQATPTISAEVAVTGLSPGNHYFVCSLGNHCQRGMRVNVTVTTDDSSVSIGTTPENHTVQWKIQDYPPLTILQGDSLTFTWEGFHSLHQVAEATFETCDINTEPIHIWGDQSVDTTVRLTDLQPGNYFFLCSIAGHCDAGMKITVMVLPSDDQPTLLSPIVAVCHIDGGCSFEYSSSKTPYITDIQPSSGAVGTEVVVSGHNLIPDGYSAGMPVPSVTVMIGLSSCAVVTVDSSETDTDTVRCTVTDNEAGYHFVDLTNDLGLAAVSPSEISPGPHRNISEPQGLNSPYPQFLLVPIVTSIFPDTGSTQGGTKVTIVGSGFSPVTGRMSLLLGNHGCAVTSSTYSEIVCVTSEGGEGDGEVTVIVNGFEAQTSAAYEYTPSSTPTISSVTPETGVSGNDIEISGTNFGTDPASVSVLILGGLEEWEYGSMKSLCTVSTVTDSSITCSLPVRAAGEYLVVVHVAGQGLAVSSPTIVYELTITSLSPTQCGNGGGVVITIVGSGFPEIEPVPDNGESHESFILVLFCLTRCRVSSSSLTEMECVVDAPGNGDASSICNHVSLMYNNMEAVAPEGFDFSEDLTPTVNSISPLIGGTAGGTIVTILGSKLLPPGVTDPNGDDVIITIDSTVCVWDGLDSVPTEDIITCRTSDHRTTLLAEVKVFVRERGFALPETADTHIWFQYIDRWSSPYTWGQEGQLPGEGDSVLIQKDQIVFLDIDTPVLNLILVEGELVFEDLQDLHLQAKYIFINTGRLQVGTEESPFQHTARITLHGNVRDPEIPIFGAKVLGVRQGDLELHGRPKLRTWTRLSTTATVNSTTLVLTEQVDWETGDKIVVAATGKDGNETEENEIASISEDGKVLSLVHKLSYKHLGVTETFEGGHFIEMRAEVGLLSHNVIVEGTRNVGGMGLGEDQYGVQIMIHRSGPHPTPIRIEHTEVRYGGQAFRLGRYAIHFHLTGSMSGSYVRNCAIHHSNNRALTAHGVHDLLVEGNVAYDIKGHTFFVEDGIETNNSYIRNLGVVTRGSSSLLNTDQIPATFWITNPQNKFVGNAAVASRGYGFWYDLDPFPSGASFTTRVCPNKEPFGQFFDNTAHTCNEFGLRIWEEYTPYENGCWKGNPANATFYNFTTYNNGIHGVEFSVVGHVIADGFKIADNVQTGFEIQEALVDWEGAILKNSLIVGHTSHDTHSNSIRTGFRAQNLGRFVVSNVTFVNFDVTGMECLRACSQCKEREGGMQVWFERLQFYNSPNKAAFQWEHEVLFRDLDGSLTGYPEGGWVLPNSALLPPSHCSLSVPEFSGNSNLGGASCTSDVYFLRLAWNRAEPEVTLLGVSVNVSNEFGVSEVPWRHYRRTHLDGYMCTLPASYPHTIEWNLPIEHDVDIMSYSAGVYNIRPTDHVTITHRFVQLPDHVDISGNYQPTESGELPQFGVDPHLSWHINNNTNHTTNVTYLISGENREETPPPAYSDRLYTYQYEACPRDGCIIITEPTGPYEIRRWSNNISWTNGRPPAAGDDVTILPQWLMIVDISPPPLGRVFVHGALDFEDGRDYNFTANLILVHGPSSRITIGTATSPFQNRVTLTLTGRRSDDILPIASGLILGSKAIGVFGNVSMHGRSRDVTWTRLSSSASAGSTVVSVETNTGWLPGDRIVIAPSGWVVTEGEIRTITSISGQDITLDSPLEYSHQVFSFLDPSDLDDSSDSRWWNDGGSMAPEVGLLSHNIVVQGGEEEAEPLETNHYGCRLLVGRYRAGSTVYSGRVWLDSVEFRYCGQGGYFSPLDPRYSIAFRSSRETSVGSYVRGCSIHHGYNTAVGVHSSNGVTVSGNVVWRTVDSAFKIGGLDNRVLDNLAIFTTTVQPNNPSDNHAVDFPACFDIDAGNVIQGNAAAGSTRLGFRLAGEQCLEGRQPPTPEQATIRDNTAHSGFAGLLILGLPSDCTAVTGFTATHQWNYAIFSSTASSLVVSRVRVAVTKVGLNVNVFGPDPVQHFIGGKTIAVSDSIIIGTLPGETCSLSGPSWTPGSSAIQLSSPSFGVMMSSFNQDRSKIDGTGQWHLMKGYPVIDGVLRLSDVVFARFTANSGDCPYHTFAIGNNPISPDAVHPVVMTTTTLLNCHTDSLVFFHDPSPDWINQEDCIDMDCDGPKHALIDDRDGTFLGTHPVKGSVAPFAELRFSDYSHRLPVSWLDNGEDGATLSEVLDGRGEGVAKGNPSENCVWRETWNAYSCHSLDHRMLVIESMDPDSETRRLSPLALDGGSTGHGPYTDLLNGPMDHGWCTYYTCLKRLSTFFTIVAMGTDYHIWMTGSNPSAMRFHVLNSAPEEALRLHIWYKNPQRKDVYRDGVYIEATNTVYLQNSAIREEGGDEHIPPFNTSYSGANFFNRDTQIMHLLIKGSSPVEIRTAPVVQIAVDLAVSLDDFFDPNDLISRLAFVLKIDPSTIRVVKIVAEDTLLSNERRRRQVEGSGATATTISTTTITLEFGDPPDVNITQPSAPSVAQEIHMAGEVNDSVDIEDESNLENQTLSENQLNEDPPQTIEDYVSSLNDSVNQYVELVDVYLGQANLTETVNMIGETVINAILTNQVSVENVTITGAVVVPAPPPTPPPPPVIPPQYENLTSGGGENISVELVAVLEEVLDILVETEVVAMESTPMTIVGGNGESVEYVIPDRMVVTMEPREETGHLVHVKLTIYDASGEPVRNLGLVTPWMCHASLIHREKLPENELAQLEGVTSVPFVDGVAEFTRLRVDRKADKLTLSFTTVPDRFQTETSIEFSVVGFPESVERKKVSFLLSGVHIPNSVDWNADEVIEQIVSQVGGALDVDPSRIQDVTLQEMEWGGETVVYVGFTLLGSHESDPPDVPSLQQAGDTLQRLVHTGTLTIEVGGVTLTAVRESFDVTPSAPPTVSTATGGGVSDGDLVLIVAGGGAAVAVSLSLLLVCLTCCCGCRQKKRRKDKGERVSEKSSFSQLPRLRPIIKVNPIADDVGESSDDNIEVVPSYRLTYQSSVIPTPNLPSSPDLWDYDADDDADSDSTSRDQSQANLDCWNPTSSASAPAARAGAKVGQQLTTLTVLANQPSSRQLWRAPPTPLPPPSHLTLVQPAPGHPKRKGFKI